ncbi:MAG: SLBB domain-containing protein [Sediminibacterium sp.]
MKQFVKYLLCLHVVLLLTVNLLAQELPVDIANISDQQLAALVVKYQLAGLSDNEFEAMAKQKGLSPEQIIILKKRMTEIDPFSSVPNANYKTKTKDENTVPRKAVEVKVPTSTIIADNKSLKVFGSELFESAGLSFEPNLTIASPKNYVIGVGDEIIVDIYGLSESTKKLKVSTEGMIRFPNLGPIKVAGLTIEEAQVKIKNQAAKVYTTIVGGNTKVLVSLGQIRSIRVTLVGEVNKPGNYTVSSLSTIMNALYASGGPNAIGSFRKIELVRSGKPIVQFDLYDFLLKGDLSKNKLLQDEDVIRVGAYETRVAVTGATKKQALFDIKKGESAKEVLEFAGGFADMGYKEMIRVKRMGIKGKEVITVKANQLSQFNLVSGDTLVVDALATNYVNRISIQGAVYYPGEYGVADISNLKTLLTTAQIKENAFLDRGILRRFNADLTPSLLSFNIADILSGKEQIALQKEDSVFIYAKDAIREKYTITINGEVNQPATYAFADNMRAQDLILLAGGFKEGASLQRVEIARRLKAADASGDQTAYAIVKAIDISSNSNNEDLNFVLAPFDIVSIRKAPNYKVQIMVSVDGEVMYPGKYTLSGNTERLSDMIIRAGGLKTAAYSTAAKLSRKTKTGDYKPVGIRLSEALSKPGSLEDVILEQGDSVYIPKLIQTVQTTGAVNVPRQVSLLPGMGFAKAIRESGGFQANANRRHAYVVRANGEIKTTKRFFVLHFYPRIEPGAELIIPAKKPKAPLTTAEFIGISSGIASLAGLIIALINTTK